MGNAGPSGGTGGQFTQGSQDAYGITRISIWSGTYVNAIEVSYPATLVSVFGNTATGAVKGDVQLQAGEYITGIEGRCGEYVDSITIVTNFQRLTYGGPRGPTPYYYYPEQGEGITGFFGRTGTWIDAIGVYFTKGH